MVQIDVVTLVSIFIECVLYGERSMQNIYVVPLTSGPAQAYHSFCTRIPPSSCLTADAKMAVSTYLCLWLPFLCSSWGQLYDTCVCLRYDTHRISARQRRPAESVNRIPVLPPGCECISAGFEHPDIPNT